MIAVFVIQKTSHASNATTPLMVLLAVVSLFGAIPGYQMVTSSQHFGTWTQTAFPQIPPLCAENKAHVPWTKNWAENWTPQKL